MPLKCKIEYHNMQWYSHGRICVEAFCSTEKRGGVLVCFYCKHVEAFFKYIVPMPIIWHAYIKLLSKYQVAVIHSCREYCINKVDGQIKGPMKEGTL